MNPGGWLHPTALAVYCRSCRAGPARSVQHGYVAVARRRWPAAEWIIGDGHYASIACCGTVTVMLFATPAEAERAKALIDRTGCGHACRRDHEITDLDDTQPPTRRSRNQ